MLLINILYGRILFIILRGGGIVAENEEVTIDGLLKSLSEDEECTIRE